MLTFLAVAARKQFVVDSYHDDATGILEKNAEGKLAVTRVTLRPKITFSGEKKPTAEELKILHDQAHRGCFIANSVTTKVTVESR
jgi:organic hydroperoxide reductase OsmC/OhrA